MNILLCSTALVVALLATGTSGFCPLGSVKSAIDSTVCYKFISAKSPFLDAEEACRQQRGHLASITNGFANAFINDEALKSFGNESDGYFIGANRLADAERWVWTDASKFAYTHAAAGEPVRQPGLDCVYVAMENGLWHAGNCFTRRPFVCIVPQSNATECPPVPTCPTYTAPPPAECTTPTAVPPTRGLSSNTTTTKPIPTTTAGARCENGWERFVTDSGVYCYRVGDYGYLLDTIATCAQWQSTAVSIHSEEENEFVRRLGSALSTGWWLGLHWTSGSDGKYRWIDGTRYGYSAWTADDTREDFTKCAQMLPQYGYWYYDKCEVMAYSICKKPAHT